VECQPESVEVWIDTPSETLEVQISTDSESNRTAVTATSEKMQTKKEEMFLGLPRIMTDY
jgi:hypothetical protein